MGHEFVLNDCEAGSWLGAPCVVNDHQRLIEAKTQVASEILVINRQAMLSAGEAWPLLYRNLLRHNVEDSRGLYMLLTGMAFYPLRARVAGRLVELSREHGSELEGGVNRIFREWEKSGLVEHRDDLLWVRDMDTLEKEVVPFE
jgi:CRP-like cAMP-binding protein